MKRTSKLLVLLLVLAALAGATYGAGVLSRQEEAQPDSEVTIFTLDPDTVTQLRWKYSEDITLTCQDGVWAYASDDAFPLDETYVTDMLQALTQITAEKTIENVENWDQYTLEAPVCQIDLTAGGTDYTIKVGQESTLGGQRYVSIGDGCAYLVSSSFLTPFQHGLYDLVKMEEVPEMGTLDALEHTGRDGSAYTIENKQGQGLAYSDDYIWFLEDRPLDTDRTESLLRGITGLSWQTCADYNALDLSRYGLDDPAAVLTAYYTQDEAEKAFTLEIGDSCDNGYYIRIAGSSMVYTIPTATAEALLYTTYADLRPEDVLRMDWDQVSAIDILLDGQTYRITRSTGTDDEGNTTVTYQLAGEQIDGDAITNALDDLDATGYADGDPGTPEIQFVIHQSNAAFPEVSLDLCRYNSTACLVRLDGETTVCVSRADVVSLVETVNAQLLD